VNGRLLLDVVVGQRARVVELFPSKNEALLVRRDALLVLNFLLDRLDGIAGLDLERDRFAGEGFDENLHDDDVRVCVCETNK